jgi:hypothetical protein
VDLTMSPGIGDPSIFELPALTLPPQQLVSLGNLSGNATTAHVIASQGSSTTQAQNPFWSFLTDLAPLLNWTAPAGLPAAQAAVNTATDPNAQTPIAQLTAFAHGIEDRVLLGAIALAFISGGIIWIASSSGAVQSGAKLAATAAVAA